MSRKTKKAFTLIEMVVAIGILAIMVSFAGAVFKVSIESYRVATANTEIMQKFRAITYQLNADFAGLRKEGEIFVVWLPFDYDNDGIADGRFDRIMFFANGDFYSYDEQQTLDTSVVKIVRGNVARISYMLARADMNVNPINPDVNDGRAWNEKEPQRRNLSRTQHILTADDESREDCNRFPFVDVTSLVGNQWYEWRDHLEYDIMTLQGWIIMPWEHKAIVLSMLTDIIVDQRYLPPEGLTRGTTINLNPIDPDTIHSLLAEGVGEFMIQGWSDQLQQWVPQTGHLQPVNSDSIDTQFVSRVLYNPRYGGIGIEGIEYDPNMPMDEEHFNEIPGLGRALRFTFTLYDSRGIITNGRTFSYIVYLDE